MNKVRASSTLVPYVAKSKLCCDTGGKAHAKTVFSLVGEWVELSLKRERHLVTL